MSPDYSELINNTQAVIVNCSLRGIVLHVSPNINKISHYEASELQGKHIFRFLSSEIKRKLVSQSVFALSNKTPVNFSIMLSKGMPQESDFNVSLNYTSGKGFYGVVIPVNVRDNQRTEVVHKQLELLRTTLESLDDFVFVVNKEGIFSECYPAEGLYGIDFSSGMFLGKTFENAGFPEQVVLQFEQAIQKAKETGKIQQLKYSLQVFGGEFFYQAKISPRFTLSRQYDGATILISDISNLIKSEQKLQLSLNYYLTILDKFPNMVFKVDIHNQADYFNTTWLEYTGRQLDHELGRGWTQGMHPDERLQLLSYMQQKFEGREAFRIDFRLRNQQGNYRWMMGVGHPNYDIQNKFAGFIVSCLDIHEEKTTRKLLMESEYRYRTMVENQVDLVCRWDNKLTLTFVNSALCNLTGKSADLMVGKKWTVLFNADIRAQIRKSLKDAPAKDQAGIFEVAMLDGQQQEKIYQWIISPVFNPDGEVAEYQAVARDITLKVNQQKENETLLRELNDRIKELSLFNTLSGYIHTDVYNPEELLKLSAEMLPEAFQMPTRTSARIILGRQVFLSPSFKAYPERFYTTFRTGKEEVATIEVFVDYQAALFQNYPPFLEEEKSMLKIICDLFETYFSRHKAEKELQISEKRYRDLFDSVLDIVFTTDFSGNIKSVNRAAQLILGYDEMVGRNVKNFIAPSSLNELIQVFRHVIAEKKTSFSFETKVVDLHGSIRFLELNCFVKYFDHKAIEVFGIARDITDQRQASKKLMRAIIVTEEKERKRFAEELHDGLGPLLSGIKMYLQQEAFKENLKEKQLKLLYYCQELVDDAIGQTRIIANNLMPSLLNDFGLAKALNSFVKKINLLGKVTIKLEVGGEIHKLGADESVVVYRVITELINNSLKHANCHHIGIELMETEGITRINYQDDGIGLDWTELKKDAPAQGMGLKNIVNRVKSINGSVEIGRGKGSGMFARIILPLET